MAAGGAGDGTQPASRYEELDALRGIAALMVVSFHFMWIYPRIYRPDAPRLIEGYHPGYLGVHLFFMISGFVIFMSLGRAERLSDFVVSRFARLYPVYWAAVLLTTAAVIAFPLVTQARFLTAGAGTAAVVVLANLTMLEAFALLPMVDPSYWSLGYELVFYALMALLFTRGWLGRIEPISLGFLLFFYAVIAATAALPGLALPSVEIPHFATIPFAHLFIGGIMFHQIRHDRAGPRTYVILALCLGIPWAIAFAEPDPRVHGHHLRTAGITMGFFAVFALIAFDRLRFLAVRPLVFLGTISYSLYLIHQVFGFVLMRLLERSIEDRATVLAIATVSVLVVATGLTYGVEKPAQRAIKRWWAMRKG